MRWTQGVPVGLFALGLALATDALARGVAPTGGTTSSILNGAPLEFALGCGLLLGGFLTAPLLWFGRVETPRAYLEPEAELSLSIAPASDEEVAVIVIGPIPVFVGAWRKATTRLRWTAMVSGSVLLLALVLALLAS